MADNSLQVGRCHYQTGRKRYHMNPSAELPWELPATLPSPHQADPPNLDLDLDLPDAAVPEPDPDSDSDSDSDSNQGDDNGQPANAAEAPQTLPPLPPGLLNPSFADLVFQGAAVTTPGFPFLVQVIHNDQNNENDMEVDNYSDASSVSVTPAPHGIPFGAVDNSDDNDVDFDFDGDGGDVGDDDDDDEDPDVNEDVPEIAASRINLTVLSQRYNMYAVAYRDKIHVFRVASCIENNLPGRPGLVLKPPTSQEGLAVGGFIDMSFPHQINHMIVGELGEMEILVVAYDDGDVIAYHTLRIENELLRREVGGADSHGTTRVKPFFHQNVGKTAWGLAIHQKSRLIAVGTNLYNVHVFALALKESSFESSEGNVEGRCTSELFLRLRKCAGGEVDRISAGLLGAIKEYRDQLAKDLTNPPKNPIFHRREYNYHIILETGRNGNNIPNVTFGDDDDGNADDVVAVDISGNIWVMNIWALDRRPHWAIEGLYQTYASSIVTSQGFPHSARPPKPFGWGVLVLPESSFMPTSSFRDSLGLDPEEATYVYNAGYGYYIGTRKAIEHVKDNSTIHPWVRSHQTHRFMPVPIWHPNRVSRIWYDISKNRRLEWTSAQDEAADKEAKHQPQTLTKTKQTAFRPRFLVAKGRSVIRTYDMAIELIGGDDDNPGIMMDYVIHQAKPSNVSVPPLAYSPERLAHLLHVPELSLVVAGSGCGRVALVTLTRPTNPRYSFKRGFKIEAVLPTAADEDHRIRPLCPLLGVAFGPIPSAGENDRLIGERRYRLMLHYYDLRILSYEVYRNIANQELSIFWV